MAAPATAELCPPYTAGVRNLDDVFAALERSAFRRRFRLGPREQAYLRDKGLPVVLAHAADFVAQRLAPAQPRNDGKQTPMRGHPVFHRAARHRDLLPRLPGEMARDPGRARTGCAAAGARGGGDRALAARAAGATTRMMMR